ncbi:MAG: GntR family transcriptional regulator [Burkholderiales bacterium]|nr:GntR family transcriptional regulator [Burkholderiales bacterium]
MDAERQTSETPGAHTGGQLPLYKEVKRLLTQSLAEGEWLPGVALPSETRLGERYRVSIGTLRKAIDELVAERILLRHQGRGTFVASHDARRTLFHFFHIVPAGGGKEQPETELLSFDRAKADADAAARLDIRQGAPVFRIRNLLRLAGKPVVLDVITLPAARFPKLSEKVFRERDTTIYQLYQERYGINVVRSAERLSAALADRTSAKLLGIPAGSPLLRIKRTALTYHNVPVELRESLVNTAEHEYFSDLGKT